MDTPFEVDGVGDFDSDRTFLVFLPAVTVNVVMFFALESFFLDVFTGDNGKDSLDSIAAPFEVDGLGDFEADRTFFVFLSFLSFATVNDGTSFDFETFFVEDFTDDGGDKSFDLDCVVLFDFLEMCPVGDCDIDLDLDGILSQFGFGFLVAIAPIAIFVVKDFDLLDVTFKDDVGDTDLDLRGNFKNT